MVTVCLSLSYMFWYGYYFITQCVGVTQLASRFLSEGIVPSVARCLVSPQEEGNSAVTYVTTLEESTALTFTSHTKTFYWLYQESGMKPSSLYVQLLLPRIIDKGNCIHFILFLKIYPSGSKTGLKFKLSDMSNISRISSIEGFASVLFCLNCQDVYIKMDWLLKLNHRHFECYLSYVSPGSFDVTLKSYPKAKLYWWDSVSSTTHWRKA